jgi:glyoxylase-like metal-dependent hydrolase (beta-lactamase superfamily II)/ferredoxin
MARLRARLAENAPGTFFVDDSCIDCDACRQIAPLTFGRSNRVGQSVVAAQPADEASEARALMALVACPTASIGTSPKLPVESVLRAFPERVDENVFACGWRAEASYGAASFLIVRPEGNVLIDSPRASRPLLEEIARLGGVKTLLLTHRDDVADHQMLVDRFGCARVMHEDDADGLPIESIIRGTEPVALDHELTVIPVPGHTRGSIALLYREKYLFTGDHLWGDEDDGALEMGRSVCWYSWPEQVRSLERLLSHRFEWVLPGHGRPYRAGSVEAMRLAVAALAKR